MGSLGDSWQTGGGGTGAAEEEEVRAQHVGLLRRVKAAADMSGQKVGAPWWPRLHLAVSHPARGHGHRRSIVTLVEHVRRISHACPHPAAPPWDLVEAALRRAAVSMCREHLCILPAHHRTASRPDFPRDLKDRCPS